jgi:NAD(P)-dependent dehydrogenase (short-subunit alcohol dehydrogenase family)
MTSGKEEASMASMTGLRAIVTGGASGIGESVARELASRGARVCVADINAESAGGVASALGGGSFAQTVDVASPDAAAHAVETAVGEMGGLEIVVNCAGIGFVGGIEETTPDDMARLWSVNVLGIYNVSRASVSALIRSGHGSIVNMGSVAGLVGVRRRFAYCATKGAVIAMTRQMAVDYASTGLRVNCIAPGTVDTPFVDGYLARFHAGEEEKVRAELHARQPIGRMGKPHEVALLAAYLASPESAFVTGSVFTIDGGWTAQ